MIVTIYIHLTVLGSCTNHGFVVTFICRLNTGPVHIVANNTLPYGLLDLGTLCIWKKREVQESIVAIGPGILKTAISVAHTFRAQTGF